MNDIEKVDIEKVIETLKDMKGVFGSRSHEQYSLYAIDLAILALEKELTKNAISDSRYPAYFESWLFCPICYEPIPEYIVEDNTRCYCIECGQRLEWMEEKQ